VDDKEALAGSDVADGLERTLAQLADKQWSREEVSGLIGAFGRSKGAEGLALDEGGMVWLTIDEASEVCLIHLPHLAGLVAAAPMPAEVLDAPAALRGLLQANMSWPQTQGGCFGIVPPADEPMLCQLIPLAALDPDLLDQRLAGFVELAQDWYDQIDLYLDQLDEDAGAPMGEPEAALPPLGARV
jgi:hypothetical protein